MDVLRGLFAFSDFYLTAAVFLCQIDSAIVVSIFTVLRPSVEDTTIFIIDTGQNSRIFTFILPFRFNPKRRIHPRRNLSLPKLPLLRIHLPIIPMRFQLAQMQQTLGRRDVRILSPFVMGGILRRRTLDELQLIVIFFIVKI